HKKAVLVGHDWGAVVAWHVARTAADRLRKLAVLNVPHPAVMMKFLTRSIQQIRKSWYIFFFQLPGLPELLFRAHHWRVALRILQGSRPDVFTETDYEIYRAAWEQPGAITAMLNWYRAMFRSRPAHSQSQRIHVPTLVIWGKQDVALSHEMAQPSVELCDHGRLVMLDTATHWVQHDEPQQVNQLLLAFLNN
ncbi:MAG: alpha/beta hydrolase, partial [Anaerolineae bacterium]|nr:alpha/beta hydrolase [Anaerolineae bacterium]